MFPKSLRSWGARSRSTQWQLSFAVVLTALLISSSQAQLPANIQRRIRPFVHVQFPGIANSPVALGVFDTGNDNITIPPETTAHPNLGIGIAAGTEVWQNDTRIGVFTNITAGGYLGAALDGPEVNTGGGAGSPGHILTGSSRLANSSPAARGTFAPSLTYFVSGGNNANSLINLGTAFVSRVAGGEGNLVAEVDPINASAMPFALGNINPATMNPMPDPGEPVKLNPQTNLLNNRASSVSFFPTNSFEVPTLAQNRNPGFLNYITYNTATNFTRTTAVGGGGAPTGTTVGPLLTKTTLAANNVFGIPAGDYKPDTGAPDTGAPGNGLLGTDNLNGFGQYWDFSANANNDPDGAGPLVARPTILLFGPTRAGDKNILGPGALIGVDRNAVGLARTAVNELRVDGISPIQNPGAAAKVYTSNAQEQAVGVYRTHGTHSNALYISGRDAYGTGAFNRDDLDALSLGGDQFGLRDRTRIYFSVDNLSIGETSGGVGLGGGVPGQFALDQSQGDVFESDSGAPVIFFGKNRLRLNQDVLGLGGNVGPLVSAIGRGNADNLNSLDLRTQDAYGKLGLNIGNVMRNLDPPMISAGDTNNPDGALTGGLPARDDVLGTSFDTFFSFDAASTGLAGNSAADVLRNKTSGLGFDVFAPAATAGLLTDDDIDAIALSRPTLTPGLALDPGTDITALDFMSSDIIDGRYVALPAATVDDFSMGGDVMLFSLAPTSASLGIFDPTIGRLLSAADVFVTDFDGSFSLFATAESLGLLAELDNIDALDAVFSASVVPEPRCAVLLFLAMAATVASRKR